MATKKPKTSKASTKAKTTKPKTAAKTAEKPVSEAIKTNKVEEKTEKVEKTEKSEKVEQAPKNNSSCLKSFFAKKYEGTESILTIFKNPKFYGSLIGEFIGAALISLLIFAFAMLGMNQIATHIFVVIAIFIAIYAFSGACLNPIVTVGMMASRRISVIRGIMYIIAEIIGAWLAWLIFNSFHLAGGDTAYDLPTMTAVGEGQFWIFAMVELLGAIIIAFFFARALKYKRSVFTFGATVAGGIAIAATLGFVISVGFFQLQNNFVFNPATALMFQIFPTAGNGFGEIMGGVMQSLSIYVLLPMIGGIIGFYISDFTAKLSGEE